VKEASLSVQRHRDTYISKEDALWFQVDGLVTMVIVQEVLEMQERQSTHLALVF